ncbi:unnamed protein product [Pylaiella littoralis]
MSQHRSLEDAEDLLAKGIFQNLLGGVTDMIATTDGLAQTQEALLTTSRELLKELRLHDTSRQADAINGRADKVRLSHDTSDAVVTAASGDYDDECFFRFSRLDNEGGGGEVMCLARWSTYAPHTVLTRTDEARASNFSPRPT